MELGNLIWGNSRGEYPVNRFMAEDMFLEFLGYIGCDAYGHAENPAGNLTETYRGGVENEVFCIAPYYWGEDEAEAKMPNFVYKPNGIEIKWYKYPMRDAYSNTDLTEELLEEILNKCKESVDKNT